MAGLAYPTAQGIRELRRPPIHNPYTNIEPVPAYDRKIFRRLKKDPPDENVNYLQKPLESRWSSSLREVKEESEVASDETQTFDNSTSVRSDLGRYRYMDRPYADASTRRKGDVVSLGQAYRTMWRGDKFLQNGKRKFDIKTRENAGTHMHQSKTLQPRPTYIPPHEKRRDELRLYVREQMRTYA